MDKLLDTTELTSIAANISELNAQDLELGIATVRIALTETTKGSQLVVYVNDQPVYSNVAAGGCDTYSGCCEAIERYMNSY